MNHNNETSFKNNKEDKQFSQWKKRVACFRFIYSSLVMNWSDAEIKTEFQADFAKSSDNFTNKVIAFFIKNKNQIAFKINSLLKEEWSYDRLNLVDVAILMEAVCEFFAHKIDRKIIIDQAIITAKKYSEQKAYKFINYLLDKLLVE
ncbi:MAG: hypothetical protein HUJ42_02145 [Malacoplasma sp.]|nr:hypothetical protein [Malacoplasma sp.]